MPWLHEKDHLADRLILSKRTTGKSIARETGMDEHMREEQPVQGIVPKGTPTDASGKVSGAQEHGVPETEPGTGERPGDRAQTAARDGGHAGNAGAVSDDLFGAASNDPSHDSSHDTFAQGAARVSQRSQTRPHPHRSLRSQLAEGMDRMSKKPFLQGKTWSFLLSVNILMAVVLSFILVWVSIERMDINYFINLERSRLREKQSLHGKLEVEKERLLSPYELRLKAEKLGMKAPAPGQIRRMDLSSRVPGRVQGGSSGSSRGSR